MKEKAVSLYQSGLSLSQVSEEMGRNINFVRKALRHAGVKARPRHCGIGKKPDHSSRIGVPQTWKRKVDYDEVARLYDSGLSLNKIADQLGVESECIRRSLDVQGIERRRRGSGAGEGNHQYKGGVRKGTNGYIVQRGTRAKPLEHRVIAEKALGRKLERDEVVHHINCDKTDNRPENLLICTNSYHLQLHARMRKDPYWQSVAQQAKTKNQEA